MNKDQKKLFAKLEAQGWSITQGKGHYKAFPPDKTLPMVTIDCTPSDHRAWQNTISRLRRSGADL